MGRKDQKAISKRLASRAKNENERDHRARQGRTDAPQNLAAKPTPHPDVTHARQAPGDDPPLRADGDTR
jgi:hypothetical protein